MYIHIDLLLLFYNNMHIYNECEGVAVVIICREDQADQYSSMVTGGTHEAPASPS